MDMCTLQTFTSSCGTWQLPGKLRTSHRMEFVECHWLLWERSGWHKVTCTQQFQIETFTKGFTHPFGGPIAWWWWPRLSVSLEKKFAHWKFTNHSMLVGCNGWRFASKTGSPVLKKPLGTRSTMSLDLPEYTWLVPGTLPDPEPRFQAIAAHEEWLSHRGVGVLKLPRFSRQSGRPTNKQTNSQKGRLTPVSF